MTAKDLIVKHKKSCWLVCIGVVLISVLLIVWAYNSPDGFVSAHMPGWSSPDYKLLKKNNTAGTKRSDNKIDGWSKDDYVNAVTMFNSAASASA